MGVIRTGAISAPRVGGVNQDPGSSSKHVARSRDDGRGPDQGNIGANCTGETDQQSREGGRHTMVCVARPQQV